MIAILEFKQEGNENLDRVKFGYVRLTFGESDGLATTDRSRQRRHCEFWSAQSYIDLVKKMKNVVRKYSEAYDWMFPVADVEYEYYETQPSFAKIGRARVQFVNN